MGLGSLHTRKLALPLSIKELLKQRIKLELSNVKEVIGKFSEEIEASIWFRSIQANSLCLIDKKPEIKVCSTGLPLQIIGHCRTGLLNDGSVDIWTRWFFVVKTVLCITRCLAIQQFPIQQYLPFSQSCVGQKLHCQVFPGEQATEPLFEILPWFRTLLLTKILILSKL